MAGKKQRSSGQRGSGRRSGSAPSKRTGPGGGRGRGGDRSRGASGSGGRGPAGGGPTGGGPARSTAPKGLGGDHVEGRHAVRELLLAGRRRVRDVTMIDDLDPAEILTDIVELARDVKVPVHSVSRRRFDSVALTESSQGVVARAEPVTQHDADKLAQRRDAFLLVLDGVTDPGNLGALLRTAECAGVTGVLLPKHRAVHLTPTVTKTAAGAIEHLDLGLISGVPRALQRLAELGVTTIGLDAGGATSVFELPLADGRPVALVLGAEGAGLGRLARQRVDILASIPLGGDLNSLNVSVAGAVACFEVVRQRSAQHAQTPEG